MKLTDMTYDDNHLDRMHMSESTFVFAREREREMRI